MIDPAFQAHLDGTATTLCHCWRLTRTDAVVLGFTDHDRTLTVDGTAFMPSSGLSASEARSTEGLGVSGMEVAGALSADDVTEDDILEGRYDGATVETLLVNWAAPAQFARIATATIARVMRGDGYFVAELEGRGRGLDVVHGRHVARHCDARVGDARCGVNLADPAYAGSGTVTGVEGAVAITAAGLTGFADGWFDGGTINWTSGAKAGRSERITTSRNKSGQTTIGYWATGAALPQAGDTFTVRAGCDKSFATCRMKFGNGLNFRGFPYLPGNDAAYAYVSQDGEFDGAPVVP